MRIDRRTVSRKTPRDGKLEISPAAATRLRELPGQLRVEWGGEAAPATIVSMSCNCGGSEQQHEHYFLESEIFRTLPVGEDVDVALESGVVHVAMTPSS